MSTQKPNKEIIQMLERVEKMREEVKEKNCGTYEIIKSPKIEPKKTIADMPYGIVFQRVDYSAEDTFIKVRPTSYLLNSPLIQENLKRGNVLIVNTKYFTVSIVKASELVEI